MCVCDARLVNGNQNAKWKPPCFASRSVPADIFVALPVSIVTWIITAALGTAVTVPSGDFIQTTVCVCLLCVCLFFSF